MEPHKIRVLFIPSLSKIGFVARGVHSCSCRELSEFDRCYHYYQRGSTGTQQHSKLWSSRRGAGKMQQRRVRFLEKNKNK